jgi:hypothetical protein
MLLRFTKIRALRWLWLQLCCDYLSSGYDATVVLSLPACKVRGLPFFVNGSNGADTSSANAPLMPPIRQPTERLPLGSPPDVRLP